MRFHGVHPFHAFPYVVRSGGMIQAFGPKMGHKAVHPQTGDVSLACEGFNDKNTFDRQTPCDQDYLHKMARRTEPELLQNWFNRDVVGIFKQHHAFDAEGIFIGDATYLFVPNNPSYENSSLMLFDEHNPPVEASKLTAKGRARCTWKRCYKLVSLIHTNWAAEFFLYAGLVVTAGQDHEAPLLYRLVEAFVKHHGRGMMKRLILDRGLLDGAQIGRCKQEWGINVLIPARKNMDIYQDVVGLAEAGELSFQPWVPACFLFEADPCSPPRMASKAGRGATKNRGPKEGSRSCSRSARAFEGASSVRDSDRESGGDFFELSDSPQCSRQPGDLCRRTRRVLGSARYRAYPRSGPYSPGVWVAYHH